MTITSAARHLCEKLLALRGYELKETGDPPRGFAAMLELAVRCGLAPGTVFDVGVGNGTPWLYDGFPHAKHVLFEPLDEFQPGLQTLAAELKADLHQVALSDTPRTVDFHASQTSATSSSLKTMDSEFAKFAEQSLTAHKFVTQTVKTQRLDDFDRYRPPYVLKIDVEGAELMVLEGARRTLEQTELIIAEISVMRRYSDEPTFAETIAALDGLGFELFDIPELSQAHNGPLIYLDAAFVPKHKHPR